MDVQNYQLRSLALVLELCNESLKNHIFKNKTKIPWETNSAAVITCQWGIDILDALDFIHGKNIVHRDLKLANVLVSHFNYYTIQNSPCSLSNRGRKRLTLHSPLFFCVCVCVHWTPCCKRCPMLLLKWNFCLFRSVTCK